jgi:hypothetical protein
MSWAAIHGTKIRCVARLAVLSASSPDPGRSDLGKPLACETNFELFNWMEPRFAAAVWGVPFLTRRRKNLF